MRILLKFELHCDPDIAWRALRSPSVFRAVSRPFTTFESLEPGGFPETWSPGPHPVRARAFGTIDIGEQIIDISIIQRVDGVRVVIDSGGATSGPLAVITYWRHSMAVSRTTAGRTLYRDQLVFHAGLATLPAWLGLWTFWQWRAARIRLLSRGWRV